MRSVRSDGSAPTRRGPEASPENPLPAEIRKHVVALAVKSSVRWLFEALRPYPLVK